MYVYAYARTYAHMTLKFGLFSVADDHIFNNCISSATPSTHSKLLYMHRHSILISIVLRSIYMYVFAPKPVAPHMHMYEPRTPYDERT